MVQGLECFQFGDVLLKGLGFRAIRGFRVSCLTSRPTNRNTSANTGPHPQLACTKPTTWRRLQVLRLKSETLSYTLDPINLILTRPLDHTQELYTDSDDLATNGTVNQTFPGQDPEAPNALPEVLHCVGQVFR